MMHSLPKLFNNSVDMILVGDSLNMSFLGERDTLSATLEQMNLPNAKSLGNVNREAKPPIPLLIISFKNNAPILAFQ